MLRRRTRAVGAACRHFLRTNDGGRKIRIGKDAPLPPKRAPIGSLKIIAAIEDPPVIVKILAHLGLPTRAPPRSPAQRFDLFQTI